MYITGFHLHKVSKTVKVTEAENGMVVATNGGKGDGKMFLSGYKGSVMEDE